MLTDLTRQERKDVFTFVGASKKIRAEAAEKDWWVVQVIRALFSSQFRDNMSFKTLVTHTRRILFPQAQYNVSHLTLYKSD